MGMSSVTTSTGFLPTAIASASGLRHHRRMSALAFFFAAIAEIAGCFSFWAWIKMGKSPLWLVPGILSLCLFAGLLTRIDTDYAGRAYAAYGGIYIMTALLWLWIIEGTRPDRWDLIGGAICLGGAAIIIWGPRSA